MFVGIERIERDGRTDDLLALFFSAAAAVLAKNTVDCPYALTAYGITCGTPRRKTPRPVRTPRRIDPANPQRYIPKDWTFD